MTSAPYRGRFAPSPTGPLHAGSLVAALGSWLDARAHDGLWTVRIEDVDTPRCVPGDDEVILAQLAACSLISDEAVIYQSQRGPLYADTLTRLTQNGWTYPCGCSRRDIDAALENLGVEHQRHDERIYPGTCRDGLHGKSARAIRVRTSRPDGRDIDIDWVDRRLGALRQNLTREAGDFVLHRADGLWAYQWAVVVDDAHAGITHVVRGEDLADNTPRQIHLQRLLGLQTPSYLHLPLVMAADGEKLSKQNGAAPLDVSDPLQCLREAGRVLNVTSQAATVFDWLAETTLQWRARWT